MPHSSNTATVPPPDPAGFRYRSAFTAAVELAVAAPAGIDAAALRAAIARLVNPGGCPEREAALADAFAGRPPRGHCE